MASPRLEPDGWLVRISAPENGESRRATGSWIGSLDLPPPTKTGNSREGEVWGVDKSLLMGGTYSGRREGVCSRSGWCLLSWPSHHGAVDFASS
jgi:hypothetical protein